MFKQWRTIQTVRGIVMSRATCDPIHLLYFIKPALNFIQVIGRMLHKTQNFTPFDPKC